MRFTVIIGCCLAFGIWGGTERAAGQALTIADVQRSEPVDFQKEILPILQRNCLACHSASEKQGALVLESAETVRSGGDSGPSVVPGRGAESLLVKVAAHQVEPAMPPAGNEVNAKPLTSEELGLLRLWIDQGAQGSGGVGRVSPKMIRPLPDAVGPVLSVALSADGQFVAATRGNRLFIHQLPSGRLIAELADPALADPSDVADAVPASAHSANQTTIPAVANAETANSETANSETANSAGSVVRKRGPAAHRDLIQSLALNQDGDLLASGSFREVKLWRRPRDVRVLEIQAAAPVTTVAVSTERGWIATTGPEHTLHLWDAGTGAAVRSWPAHSDTITSLQFMQGGDILASTSHDQSVRWWDAESGRLMGEVETPVAVSAAANAVAAAEGEAWMVSVGAEPLLRVWQSPRHAPRKSEGMPANTELAVPSAAGDRLAVAGGDGEIRVLLRRALKADELTAGTAANATESRTSEPVLEGWEVESQWKLPQGKATALAWCTQLVNGPPAADSIPAGAESETPTPAPWLVIGLEDGGIMLWDSREAKLLDQWRGGESPIASLAAVEAGTALASGAADGRITLWNMADAQRVQSADPVGDSSLADFASPPISVELEGPIRELVWNSQRTLAAMVGKVSNQPAVVIFDLEKQSVVRKLTGHTAEVRAVAFSPDSARIVTGGDDQTLRVWSVSDGTAEPQVIEGVGAAVLTVAFSPDGQQVLAGCGDQTARLWKLADLEAVVECKGHGGAVLATGFLAADQPYTVSADRQVRFWNPADGVQTRSFQDQAGTVRVAVSADGRRLALAGDDRQIRVYQLDNGQLLRTLSGLVAVAGGLSFSSDGARLAATAAVPDGARVELQPGQPAAGETIVWHLESEPPRILERFAASSTTAAYATVQFTTQPDRLVLGDTAGSLRLRKLRFDKHCDGIQQPVTALHYRRDGQLVYAAARDGTLRGFNVSNGQATFSVGHGAAIIGLTVSADEQRLATLGENSVVRLWQANGGGLGPQQIANLPGPPTCACFTPDAEQIVVACGGDRPQTLLFDMTSAALLQRFTAAASAPRALVSSLPRAVSTREGEGGSAGESRSPGNNGSAAGVRGTSLDIYAATAGGVWRWEACAVKTVAGHGAPVHAVVAIPDAPQQVWTGSQDGTLRRWNLATGQQLAQLNHGGPVFGVALRGDGRRLVSTGENRTVKLWEPEGRQVAEMRGDIRSKTLVTRGNQQSTAANQRVAVAKQQLDAVEKNVPVMEELDKKARETLAAAEKDLSDKTAALKMVEGEKLSAEKVAIEAAVQARQAVLAQNAAEQAAKKAALLVPIAQQRAAQLAAAAGAAPADETLKRLAGEAQQAVADAQQRSEQMQQAIQAPTQLAQTTANAANEASQKAAQFQKPYNDALDAVKLAGNAMNLAAQQQALAERELAAARGLVPAAQQKLAALEAAAEQFKQQLEQATAAAAAAELPVRRARFSPDGSLLVTGGDHSSVHVWDADSGGPVASLVAHAAAISDLAFTDPQHLVSVSADQTARVWDLDPVWRLERTLGAIDQPEMIADRVQALDFSADAAQLLVAGGVPSRSGELQVWNVIDGARTLSLPQAHDDVIFAARFSPDGKRVATGGADKYLRTWDLASSQLLRRFEGHTNYVLGVAWKGDGQVLVSAGGDNTLKVWDAETADQQRTIENISKPVTGVRYIGESDNIASASGDGMLRMHNAANGGNFRNLSGQRWLHAVDVTPDNAWVAAGSATGEVLVWNGNDGRLMVRIDVGREPLTP
jgi:WD40 repeat protein